MRKHTRAHLLGRGALLAGLAILVPACVSSGDPSGGGMQSGDPPAAGTQPGQAVSENASISGDGTLIAFDSTSTLLAPVGSFSTGLSAGTVNLTVSPFRHIFIFNRTTGAVFTLGFVLGPNISLVSSTADSFGPRISSDGTFVVFQSTQSFSSSVSTLPPAPVTTTTPTTPAPNPLIPAPAPFGMTGSGPTGSTGTNILRTEVATGQTTVVTSAFDGTAANGTSSQPSVSGDGSTVAFQSGATNLMSGPLLPMTGIQQVFVKNMNTGLVTLVSVSPTGAPANADSLNPAISEDGTVVAFESRATNLAVETGLATLAAGATPPSNIFIHSLITGRTTLVTAPPGGGLVNGDCTSSSLDTNGGLVAFESTATNLVPLAPSVPAGTSSIFVWNAANGQFTLASPPALSALAGAASGSSHHAALSANGGFVAFDSAATDLTADANIESGSNVFVRNLQTGTTALVSRAQSSGASAVSGLSSISQRPSINTDGQFVAFDSNSPRLVSTTTHQSTNIFVSDLVADTISLASPELTPATPSVPTFTIPSTPTVPAFPIPGQTTMKFPSGMPEDPLRAARWAGDRRTREADGRPGGGLEARGLCRTPRNPVCPSSG